MSISGSSDLVVRSRTWSADITKNWNKNTQNDTVKDRAAMYEMYFTLDADQLRFIMKRFIDEIDIGLKLHHADPITTWPKEKCSLKLLDTCVDEIPTGREHGVAYALDFGGTNLRAVRVKLEGEGRCRLTQSKVSLLESAPEFQKGLLDKNATATQLFDVFADTIKGLMQKEGDSTRWANVGFTFSFPISQKTLTEAHLMNWTKEFETGRTTNDCVEGNDVGGLLNQAFWRREVTAKQTAVLNDTTGTLLSCAYEKPIKLPPCVIGVILGTGVNGCYYQQDAKDFKYNGRVINTELGAFDKGLPVNDVDLEIDFANEATRGDQLFEKMISGKYIGEICRRLVVKVYQKLAPQLAWLRDSMPPEACGMVLSDNDADLSITQNVLEGLWEWEVPKEDRVIVKRLFSMVFDRSAALAASVIAGMAKKTRRLLPAMGGLTVGIDGSLYTQNVWYAKRVRHHLDQILGPATGGLVHLCIANDGSGKGAAILAATQKVAKH